MTPPKRPSGAQNRKRKKERQEQDRRSSLEVANRWMNQAGYNSNYGYMSSNEQFDPNAPPQELPLYGQPPATFVKSVAATLLMLEQGQFYAPSYLWDGMLRDDRVAAVLEQRINRLIGSDLEIEPAEVLDEQKPETAGEDTKDTIQEQVAEDCKRLITKIMPLHQVAELMRYALGLSVGIAQVTSTITLEARTPTFRVWNPRYLRFDWLLRKFRLVTENRGEITLEPDDPEWIIYEPFGPYGWLHGAMMRATVQPWIIRYWVRTWWARHQEVHGQPLRLGIIPAQREPADEKLFLSQLSNLAHEAVIRLPRTGTADKEGFDVRLLESASDAWEGFKQLLDHCDDSIAILYLGQRQSTMGQGGLGTQENAGEDSLVRIARKDALVADTLRDQLLKPWAADNYGDPELAPFLKWNVDPPEDEKQAADVDLKVSQACGYFKTSGAPIDIRKFLEDRGYPLLTEEQHLQQKQDAVEDAQAMMIATTPAPPEPEEKDDAK
jgi:hypothetical protein